MQGDDSRPSLERLTTATVWLGASRLRRPLRIGPLRGGAGAGRMQHGEWNALLMRFAADNALDYTNFRRVRRLLEAYLSRLAATDPESFADADDQLAYYLNAYNAIAVYQILLHDGAASLRAIPGAFTRSFPLGRRNLSLHTLHSGVLRAFGDPRVHAAVVPAAQGAILPTRAFTGATLQTDLDAAIRGLLHDPQRGAQYDSATHTVILPAMLRVFAGDFLYPHQMPGLAGLLRGWRQPQRVASAVIDHLPPPLQRALNRQPQIAFRPFDWSLNDRSSRRDTFG
jgi:hypothetical protein